MPVPYVPLKVTIAPLHTIEFLEYILAFILKIVSKIIPSIYTPHISRLYIIILYLLREGYKYIKYLKITAIKFAFMDDQL
jgi:hypothetical protein